MARKPARRSREVYIMRRNPHPPGSDASKAFEESERKRLGIDEASLERKRKQGTNYLGDTPAEREKNKRIIRDLGKVAGAAFKKKLQQNRTIRRPRVYRNPVGGRKILARDMVRRVAQVKAEAEAEVEAEVEAEAEAEVKAEAEAEVTGSSTGADAWRSRAYQLLGLGPAR